MKDKYPGGEEYNRLISLDPTKCNHYLLSINEDFINLEMLITHKLREGPRSTRNAILKKHLDDAGYSENSNEYKNLILANGLLYPILIDLDGGKRKKNKRSLRKSVKRRLRRTIRRRTIRRSIRRRR